MEILYFEKIKMIIPTKWVFVSQYKYPKIPYSDFPTVWIQIVEFPPKTGFLFVFFCLHTNAF